MAERIALLDVNVLIALIDPRHVHHEPSHRWFEAHGGHGRAILAGLLAGGLRWWIIGGFFRALALGTPEAREAESAVVGGAAVCSSDERDEFGFWTPLVDIEAAADGSKRSRRHRSRATSVPAPPPGKAHRWQWGNWGKSGGWARAHLAGGSALGLRLGLIHRFTREDFVHGG